jgi:ABC-type polysaccharide/polyol phosphate transport system ATPase subunit
MSSDAVAIRLENVSKRYRTGRSRTLADVLASALERARGREREVFGVTRRRAASTFFALRDVSFEVAEGTGLGIIGANGAGKTSLLKLISRVTWPTSGRVRVAGRVVSLIELGAGFHPELTGRENVYLGAGLFGLTRRDVDARFDEIVQFAEVEPLIDMPMKRYSSGLYARLGFSVAIHSNPDIVLVDEVLAVGDAAFRRRALESLRGLIAAGKTVLFISHDMWNVRRLCKQIVWLEEGRIRGMGPAAQLAEQYIEEVNVRALAGGHGLPQLRGGTGEVRYCDVQIIDAAGRPTRTVPEGGPLTIRAAYVASVAVAAPVFQVSIIDVDSGLAVATAVSSTADGPAAVDGRGEFECTFDAAPLVRRQYIVRLAITDAHRLMSYDVVSAATRFAVVGAAARCDAAGDEDGLVSLPYRFEHRAGVPS